MLLIKTCKQKEVKQERNGLSKDLTTRTNFGRIFEVKNEHFRNFVAKINTFEFMAADLHQFWNRENVIFISGAIYCYSVKISLFILDIISFEINL